MFEWDEAKRQTNIGKHGIDFAAVEDFEWATASVMPDDRQVEPRLVATGYIGGRLHVVVYTTRADRRRIISVRKANAREEERHVRRYGPG